MVKVMKQYHHAQHPHAQHRHLRPRRRTGTHPDYRTFVLTIIIFQIARKVVQRWGRPAKGERGRR